MDEQMKEMANQLRVVTTRLAHTESELRRLKRKPDRSGRVWQVLGIMGAALMLGGVTVASASPGAMESKVRTPFEVVDHSGNPVMIVDSNGLRVDRHGKVMVTLGSSPNGGTIATQGPGGNRTSSLGYDNQSGGPELFIGQEGSYGASLGLRHGNLGLRFFEGDNETAAIGETANGSGAMDLYKTSGDVSLGLGTDSSNRGFLEIEGKGGQAAAQLFDCDHGGCLELGDNSGIARVEAGTTSQDVGVVRAIGTKGVDFIIGR